MSLWREAHLEVKMYKTPPGADHVFKLRCRKMPGRCGEKQFCKSKCLKKSEVLGPLCEVQMLKNGRALWREAQKQGISDHYLKFRCRKTARRCGAKQIFKSKKKEKKRCARATFLNF